MRIAPKQTLTCIIPIILIPDWSQTNAPLVSGILILIGILCTSSFSQTTCVTYQNGNGSIKHWIHLSLKITVLVKLSCFDVAFEYLMVNQGNISRLKIYWIMCILCTRWPTYGPTVDWRIGRHIGRVSTDMSVDISVKCRSICRSRCVARFIGWHINWASVDMSTDTRPICSLICWPRVVVCLSPNMSIDRLPTFRRYFTATFILVTVDII